MIFVNESAANERTKDRKWGWSLKGTAYKLSLPAHRSRRWSLLSALGLNGYLDYIIVYRSFISDRFNLFIRMLLRKMNPYPGPRSVLVMDNVIIYRLEELKEIYKEIGIILEYLSPYSLDFNLIKESFSSLKA